MEPTPARLHLAHLADILWCERRLLEYLMFKLVSANLVLTANDRRLVGPAIAEVERVVTEVRRAETDRIAVIESLAADWGVTTQELTLADIAEMAPEDLRDDFVDHHIGFPTIVAEIEELTRENRRLANVSLEDIRNSFGLNDGVAVNVTAFDAFGFASGKDVFTVLDDVEAALIAADQAGIDTGIGELQASMKTVLTTLTGLGAVGSRIEAARTRIGDDTASLKAQLSSVEDVDIAEAVLEMQLQETAYAAALGAFARSSRTSLLDFLR